MVRRVRLDQPERRELPVQLAQLERQDQPVPQEGLVPLVLPEPLGRQERRDPREPRGRQALLVQLALQDRQVLPEHRA